MLCPKIRELIKLFIQQREQKVTMLCTVISQPMKSLTIQWQTSHIRHHDERANKITFVSSLGGFHGFCSQYHFHTETRRTISTTSHAKSMAQTTDDNVHFTLKQWNIKKILSAGLSAMWIHYIHPPSTNIQEHFYQIQTSVFNSDMMWYMCTLHLLSACC